MAEVMPAYRTGSLVVPERATRNLAWLVGIALVLTVAVWIGRSAGILRFGFSPDGYVYVDSARNLLHGNGLSRSSTPWDYPEPTVPLKHLAPAYPALLGVASFLSRCDPADVAPFVGLLLYGLNVGLVGWLVWNICPRPGACVTTMLLVGLSKPILLVHLQALSEPLFLSVFLLFLKELLDFYSGPDRRTCITVSVLIGIMTLIRYQGLFLIPVWGLILLCRQRGRPRQIFFSAIGYVLLATLPFVLWWLRTKWVYPQGALREWEIHWMDYGAWWTLVNTPANWLTPRYLPQVVRLLLVVSLVAGAVVIALRTKQSSQAWHYGVWLAIVFLITLVQLMFLVVVRCFYDSYMPFDDRILSLIHVSAMITFSSGLFLAWTIAKKRMGRLVVIVAAVMIGSSSLYHAWGYLKHTYVKSQDGDMKDVFSRLPELAGSSIWMNNQDVVYSNGANHVYWHLAQPAKYVPDREDAESVRLFFNHVVEHGGLIVHIQKNEWRTELVDLEMLKSASFLEATETVPGIWLFRPTPSDPQNRDATGASMNISILVDEK